MFKLNHIKREIQFEGYSSDKNTSSSQVAIYNEDDLSHLLFLESADHGSHIIINKVDHSEPETPLESPLVIDTHCHTSDDESAILSDWEEESDMEIPRSPPRRHGGTMSVSDDDFEFPVFLGRQQQPEEELAPVAPAPLRPALRRVDGAAELQRQNKHKEAEKHVQIVAPTHHVTGIQGPLMSWWPAEIEDMQYDWAEKSNTATMSSEQHVSHIEGPLMAWWPASTEMLQHDWNERFYE